MRPVLVASTTIPPAQATWEDLDEVYAPIGAPAPAGEAFPVGALFFSAVSTNPATLLGYGTWQAWGAGKVFVCYAAGDPDFGTLGAEGGVKDVTLTAAQSGLPAHRHQTLRERSATTGGATTQIARTGDTSSTVDTNVFTENVAAANAAEAHTNLMPFKVGYAWERVT